MELKDVIYGRRSIRKFKEQQISEQDIREIVDAGIMAPSATNIQHWYFIAICNPEALSELRDIAADGAAAFREKLEKRFPDHPDVVASTTNFIGSLGNAPFVVLAFLRSPEQEADNSPAVQSVAAAIENMVLAAYDKGIGSCWMTSLSAGDAAEAIHERFAPDRGSLLAIVTFGYPDQEPKCPKRKDDRVEFII